MGIITYSNPSSPNGFIKAADKLPENSKLTWELLQADRASIKYFELKTIVIPSPSICPSIPVSCWPNSFASDKSLIFPSESGI